MWFLFKCFHEDVVLLRDGGVEVEGRVSEKEKVPDRDCEGGFLPGCWQRCPHFQLSIVVTLRFALGSILGLYNSILVVHFSMWVMVHLYVCVFVFKINSPK